MNKARDSTEALIQVVKIGAIAIIVFILIKAILQAV